MYFIPIINVQRVWFLLVFKNFLVILFNHSEGNILELVIVGTGNEWYTVCSVSNITWTQHHVSCPNQKGVLIEIEIFIFRKLHWEMLSGKF